MKENYRILNIRSSLENILSKIYNKVFCAKDRAAEKTFWHSLIQENIEKTIQQQGVPKYLTDPVEKRYYSKLFAQIKKGAHIQNWKDHEVIELGSGFGILSYYFYIAGANCTLVDNSNVALAYSRLVFEKTQIDQYKIKKRVNFLEANCEHLPLGGNKYDLIFSMGLIEHSHIDAEAILAESVRLAKIGAKIVFGVPNYFSPETLAIWHKWGKGTENYFRKKTVEVLFKRHGLIDVFTEASTFFFPYFTPQYIVKRLSSLEDFFGKTLRMGFLNITFGTKI